MVPPGTHSFLIYWKAGPGISQLPSWRSGDFGSIVQQWEELLKPQVWGKLWQSEGIGDGFYFQQCCQDQTSRTPHSALPLSHNSFPGLSPSTSPGSWKNFTPLLLRERAWNPLSESHLWSSASPKTSEPLSTRSGACLWKHLPFKWKICQILFCNWFGEFGSWRGGVIFKFYWQCWSYWAGSWIWSHALESWNFIKIELNSQCHLQRWALTAAIGSGRLLLNS